MEWTQVNDLLLCTEIRVREPYKFKKSSNERGKIWTEIAKTLNENQVIKFHVTQRGVRERYEILKTKFLEKIKAEENASGISPEVTELDRLLEEVIEKDNLAECSRESDKTIKKNEEDRKTAEGIRKTAMESIGETTKRSMEDEDGNVVKRKRRSGSEAVDYLRERADMEMKFREKELALKKEQRDQEATKQFQMLNQQNEMFSAMREQQSQMQNMQVMMLQQQQQ